MGSFSERKTPKNPIINYLPKNPSQTIFPTAFLAVVELLKGQCAFEYIKIIISFDLLGNIDL